MNLQEARRAYDELARFITREHSDWKNRLEHEKNLIAGQVQRAMEALNVKPSQTRMRDMEEDRKKLRERLKA